MENEEKNTINNDDSSKKGKFIDETVTFIFKLDSDNGYNLSTFKIVNK